MYMIVLHSVHIILYYEVVVEVAIVDVEHNAFTSTTPLQPPYRPPRIISTEGIMDCYPFVVLGRGLVKLPTPISV